MTTYIQATPAGFAQRILYLDGKPFSMKGLPFMVTIMNTKTDREMLMTGRQVAKSTTISAIAVSELAANPFWRSLYVAPRNDQVSQFNNDKLQPMIVNSPLIKENYVDSRCVMQTFSKEFTNGSMMYLRSCYHTADGIRGISANSVYIDEVQDIIIDNIPVIEECTARKNPKRMVFCGTPKTFDNCIQKLWDQTSQHYWAVPCRHCGHWNVPLAKDNIGTEGPICAKCKQPIDIQDGEYVAKHPGVPFIGYHVSQAMICGVPTTGIPWSRLVEKMNNPLYSESKFYNECLGFSYDNGAKLLIEADVLACCDKQRQTMDVNRIAEWGMYTVVAAVDWGVLGGNTHTVLTIGGLDRNGKLRVLYAKKYPVDQDPLAQIENIISIIRKAGVALVVADRGGGSLANSTLRRHLPQMPVHEIEYKARVTAGMQYNAQSRSWVTDRTRAMAGVILDIKNQNMIFPAYAAMKDFIPDLLTLSCEYNDRLRAFQIIRDAGTPDDFAHTLVYLRIGAKQLGVNPRLRTYDLEEFQPPDRAQDKHFGSVDAYESTD